jgi:hypothetical protein
LHYAIDSRIEVDLHLAVAEDRTTTEVSRGENAGRTLSHRHTVRAFRTVRVAPKASGSWMAPWLQGRTDVYAVAYLTQPGTGVVVGASAVDVPRND